jgi:ABC-type transporter Mla MlaB component
MKARRNKSRAQASAARKPAPARKRSNPATRSASPPAKRRAATGPREALGADCTIEHAPALHKRLAKVLANRACVTLDLGDVRRCDTAGLQVLVAFVRERREAGRDVELSNAPDALLSAVKLLGLGDVLGLKAPEAQEGRA